MRDLLFKNLTSLDKKRKILSTSETMQEGNLRTVIHRHFIYLVRGGQNNTNPCLGSPRLYVLKKKDTKQKTQSFFCRIKGSLYAACKGNLYLILFAHSLKIDIFHLETKKLGI